MIGGRIVGFAAAISCVAALAAPGKASAVRRQQADRFVYSQAAFDDLASSCSQLLAASKIEKYDWPIMFNPFSREDRDGIMIAINRTKELLKNPYVTGLVRIRYELVICAGEVALRHVGRRQASAPAAAPARPLAAAPARAPTPAPARPPAAAPRPAPSATAPSQPGAAEARRALALPAVQAALADGTRIPPQRLLSPAESDLSAAIRRACQPELQALFVRSFAGGRGRDRALDDVDQELATEAQMSRYKEYLPWMRERLGWSANGGDPVSVPFKKCAARVHLARADHPAPAAAPAKPKEPEKPRPPQVGVLPARMYGNGCVKITAEETRWSDPANPAKSLLETILVLRNTCAAEQLVEAKIDIPFPEFTRPLWSTRDGLAGARSTWQVNYPTNRLDFDPLEDKWQVFTLGPRGAMQTMVQQNPQSYRTINTAIGSCDHYVSGRERTVFVDSALTRFVCVNLPWPDERAGDPGSYRPETVTAFARQLANICTAERQRYAAAAPGAPADIAAFEAGLLRQDQIAAIRTQGQLMREVVTPASAYKRCVILERFRQFDRKWLPSWDVP